MAEQPKRIQRKRSKGWRMPEGAVCVTRPTKWGNPFKVTEDRPAGAAVEAFRTWLTTPGVDAGMPEKKAAILDNIAELRGKDLACWCGLDKPCHADVLLEIARQEGEVPGG